MAIIRSSILLLLVLWTVKVSAQDTRIYITSDDKVQFEYPADWFVLEDGSGLVIIASRQDLLEQMEYEAGEVIIFFTYESTPIWDSLFGEYDTSQPIQSLADAIYGAFAVTATSEEVLIGETLFYTTPASSYPEDPKTYITRTDSLGVIFVNAYFDGEESQAEVESILTFLGSSNQQVNLDGDAIDAVEIPALPAFSLPQVSVGQDLPPDTCEGMVLDQNESLPMREITLLEAPNSIMQEGIRAYLVLPDGTEYDVVLTDYAYRGLKTVNVPLIEDVYFEDTLVTLHIVDSQGSALCPTHSFTILALPQAPNALNNAVRQLGELLALRREALGVSVEYLRPESNGVLTLEQYALALAQFNYDDPNNPNALVLIADGTAPLVQSADFDPDLMDSIIASTLLGDYLEQQIISLSEMRPRWLNPDYQIASSSLPRVYSAIETLKVEIPDFEALVTYMNIQNDADSVGQLTNSKTFNDAALLNSLAGVATGPVGVVVGTVMYSGKALNDAAMNLLPSEITSFDLNYDGDITQEDDFNIYQYKDLRVTAKSNGWNLKYVIIDGVLTFTGFANKLDTVVQTGGEVGSNLISRVDAGNSTVDGFVTIEPFVWENIPIRYEDIASVEVVSPPTVETPAIQIDDPENGFYRAWNSGFAYLRFELEPVNTPIYLSKRIEVSAINITWDQPQSITISEGESVCFSAQIFNANRLNGRFISEGPDGTDIVETDDAIAQYCFYAPDRIVREWTEPLSCDVESVIMPEIYTVEFESMTRSGPRDPGYNPSWEKRSQFSIIRVEPLPENHLDAVRPINENCTVFAGDWEFTLNSDLSFLCTGTDVPSVVIPSNMTAAGESNLRNADIIIVDGFDMGLLTLARDDEGVYVVDLSYTEDGISVMAEVSLYLQSGNTATVITRGYSNLYEMLEPEAQAFVPLCESIAFFLVYDGVYIGD